MRGDPVGLRTILLKAKLQRTGREAKRLHGLQKRVRNQLEELEQERRKGLAQEKYEERKAKLEARRHEIIEKLKHVEAQERQVRAEVHAAERAAHA